MVVAELDPPVQELHSSVRGGSPLPPLPPLPLPPPLVRLSGSMTEVLVGYVLSASPPGFIACVGLASGLETPSVLLPEEEPPGTVQLIFGSSLTRTRSNVKPSGGVDEVPVVGSVTSILMSSQPKLPPASAFTTEVGVVNTAVAEPEANVVGAPPFTDAVHCRFAACDGRLTCACMSTG